MRFLSPSDDSILDMEEEEFVKSITSASKYVHDVERHCMMRVMTTSTVYYWSLPCLDTLSILEVIQ